MSSLAAARADNFYFPPNFDPAKHKSLNKFQGSHGALGARANKQDQGILVIRFEVPFHLWCTKCHEKIAKGERFNAEKKCIGNYLTTKIWEFRMSHHCGSCIIITTDPKNSQYCVVEGARQKVESYTAQDAEVIELEDIKEREKLRNDPLYRLEHGEQAKVKARTGAEEIAALQEANEAMYRDDYAVNKLLRARMRKAKAEDAELEARRSAHGLDPSVELLPVSESDAIGASIAFLSDESKSRSKHSKVRTNIMSQSIFSKGMGQRQSSVEAIPAGAMQSSNACAGLRGQGNKGSNTARPAIFSTASFQIHAKSASRDPSVKLGGGGAMTDIAENSVKRSRVQMDEPSVIVPATTTSAQQHRHSQEKIHEPRHQESWLKPELSGPGAAALAAAAALRKQNLGFRRPPSAAAAAAAAKLLGPGRGTYLAPGPDYDGSSNVKGKRSLKEKAELMAKRHKLGGVKLSLGSIK